MYKGNILHDVSALTTVQKSSIDRLCVQAVKCICSDVCEAQLQHETELCLDIGVGNLIIRISDDDIRYRFEPSSYLDESILESVSTGKNPVIEEIEFSLLEKINTTYKDLF